MAAAFGVAGQSTFTLTMVPVVLSGVSAVLVWRIAKRFVSDPALAILAGALAWTAPLPAVFQSTYEGGYRGLVLVCGLGLVLCSVRVLDGYASFLEFVAIGLLVGVGWWALPEIVYFYVPALLIMVGSFLPRLHSGQWAWVAKRSTVAILFAIVGALPWLWSNIQSGFASLDSGSFPGASTPLNPGFIGRLQHFYHAALPLQLNLRRLVSGDWAFVNGASSVRHAALVIVVVAVLLMLLVVIALCLMHRRRSMVLAVTVIVFPILVALQPATWFWQDGRYTAYLGSFLALAVAVASEEAARLWLGRRSPRFHADRNGNSLAQWIMCSAVLLNLALTVFDFHGSFDVSPASFARAWGNPDAAASRTVAILEQQGIVAGVADYWVAYKLDFLSNGRLAFSVDGSDPNRVPNVSERAKRGSHQAWLFVPDESFPEAAREFGDTQALVGPAGISEDQFIKQLALHGVGYQVKRVGLFDVVTPAGKVTLEGLGLSHPLA